MYTARGTTDKNTLLQRHTVLVKKIAGIMKARLPASVELDDLVQAGMIGLWEAINNFDISHNVQFETFATLRIRGAMIDELRSSDWAPRSVRSQMRAVETAITKLNQSLGRAPKGSEVADYLKMSLEEYQEILSDSSGHQLVYLEDLQGGDDIDGFLSHYESDDSVDPLKFLLQTNFRQDLISAIESLPEREKILMGLYYEQDLNLKEIGAVMGVTESRVCQLHAQSVARLRTKLKEKLWNGAA
jgi:RNA polymerase sigma factor for flagellar operon FliA